MYKIIIITTEGCAGCTVAKVNVKEAIQNSSKTIELEVKDKSEYSKRWLTTNKITDFPTILLCNSDIICYKFIGSRSPIVILRYIDLYLK